MAPRSPGGRMKGRSRQRLIAAVGLSLLVLTGATWTLWRVLPALWAAPAGPPTRDEARDLDPLPPDGENGWTVIASAPAGTFADLGGPADDLLRAREGPPSLDELERASDDVIDWSIPDSARDTIDEALARPRFVFACPLDAEATCDVLPWLHAHRAAAGLALRDALLGWDDEALERAEQLLRADRDVIATARSVLQVMVGVAAARQSIELAGWIGAIVGGRDEVAGSAELSARLDLVELALASLEPEGWSAEQALIGESIWTRHALESIARSGQGRLGLARTMEAFDHYYEQAILYARDPEHAAPPTPIEADAEWSWLDPAGSLAVGVVAVDRIPQVDQLEHEAEQARERIAAVRVALAAARARISSAPAPATP